MAITALSGLAPYWYTPEEERGEPAAAQFKLKPLNGMQFIEVMHHGEMLPDGERFVTDYSGLQLLLKYGLLDWKNIDAENGDPLPFSRRNFEVLPAEILQEIGREIMRRSALAEADRKKSSSQLRSSATSPASTAPPASGDGTATDPTPPPSSSG